jgi:putative addiction module CopG family antidote
MAEIQLDFPEPLTSYVHSQIATGRYQSVTEYLSDLVRADWRLQELLEQLKDHADLSEELDRGLRSGEGRHWTPAVLDELRNQVIDRARPAAGDP